VKGSQSLQYVVSVGVGRVFFKMKMTVLRCLDRPSSVQDRQFSSLIPITLLAAVSFVVKMINIEAESDEVCVQYRERATTQFRFTRK
jgi:hypothetical protein